MDWPLWYNSLEMLIFFSLNTKPYFLKLKIFEKILKNIHKSVLWDTSCCKMSL